MWTLLAQTAPEPEMYGCDFEEKNEKFMITLMNITSL